MLAFKPPSRAYHLRPCWPAAYLPPHGPLLPCCAHVPLPILSARWQDAEAHLQHHFESIQDIADTTTLPSLLPALSRALAAAADVETPLERLRCAATDAAVITGRACATAWHENKTTAIGRSCGHPTMAVVAALPVGAPRRARHRCLRQRSWLCGKSSR